MIQIKPRGDRRCMRLPLPEETGITKTLCLAGGDAFRFGVMANAQLPDAAQGLALYENHCRVCHAGKVRARPNDIVLKRGVIVQIARRWQAQQHLQWDEQKRDDVANDLAR